MTSAEPRYRLSTGSSIYAEFGPGNLDREALVAQALEAGTPLEDWQARHVAAWYRGSADSFATLAAHGVCRRQSLIRACQDVLDVDKRYGAVSSATDMRALIAWARGASTRDPGVGGEHGR